VFERTISKNTLLQKENAEYVELLRVRRERKSRKRVTIAEKFVFNKKAILELVEEAENKASKRKSKKRRTTKAVTPEFKEEEEEHFEKDISKGESDCIIVASSRSKSK
jgi:hypothetical protein